MERNVLLYPISETLEKIFPANCGILISNNLVLTYGTTLLYFIQNYAHCRELHLVTKPGCLTIMPEYLARIMQFMIVRKSDDYLTSENYWQYLGRVVAIWKCPSLKEALNEVLKKENFSRTKAKPFFHMQSIFVIIHFFYDSVGDYHTFFSNISKVKQEINIDLHLLLNQIYEISEKSEGLPVLTMSAPCSNHTFQNSFSRGVVSNVYGKDCSVVITDSLVFPNSAGCSVYIDLSKRLFGMVIITSNEFRTGVLHGTVTAYLKSCLHLLLYKDLPFYSIMNRGHNKNVRDIIDRSVVMVKCGIEYGTGIFIDKNTGIFLTCSHVVKRAPEMEILIKMDVKNPNSYVPATLLYKTPDNLPYDVAVLKVSPMDVNSSMEAIQLTDVPLVKGELVLSAGFPFFTINLLLPATITSGAITKSLDGIFFTSCRVQDGISGGPIISAATGKMLGMVVSCAHDLMRNEDITRISMAIPAAVLRRPLQQYLLTNNPDVFQIFTCSDPLIQKMWDLGNILPLPNL